MESGLDVVTLDGAIVDADVPRGMSYRIWQDENLTPQDAFRRETVLDLLAIPATAGLPATREMTEKLLAEHRDVVEMASKKERRRLFRDLARTVGAFNYETLASSGNWRLYMALRTAAVTRPNADPALIDVLREGERYLIEQYSLLYDDVCQAFGLRVKDGLTLEQFAAASYAVNEGLATRMTDIPERENIILPTGENGDLQSWTLFAIAFEALIDRFFTWD